MDRHIDTLMQQNASKAGHVTSQEVNMLYSENI